MYILYVFRVLDHVKVRMWEGFPFLFIYFSSQWQRLPHPSRCHCHCRFFSCLLCSLFFNPVLLLDWASSCQYMCVHVLYIAQYMDVGENVLSKCCLVFSLLYSIVFSSLSLCPGGLTIRRKNTGGGGGSRVSRSRQNKKSKKKNENEERKRKRESRE